MKLQLKSKELNEIQSLLTPITKDASWKEIAQGSYQVKTNHVSITFYSTTGSILVQGKEKYVGKCKKEIARLINENEVYKKAEKQENIPLHQILSNNEDAEIIIGLVGAVGVEYKHVKDIIKDRLEKNFHYSVEEIRISNDVIKNLPNYSDLPDGNNEFTRINHFMEFGNQARAKSKDNSILALGAAEIIMKKRGENGLRKAYIIDSLKHPDEVKLLRQVYGEGFYLIGVFSDIEHRKKHLIDELHIEEGNAEKLIARDANDLEGHGQHTSDTFHLSDFFVHIGYNRKRLKESIHRFLDLIFGHPTITPLFEEFAMFMAFTAALRSADLSRQVGAVLAKDNDIIAIGANDAPKFGGGLYWPFFENDEIIDFHNGRDYTRGEDSNTVEKKEIIQEIIREGSKQSINEENLKEILKSSRLKDLIEFGRVVHAEMEALLVCARNNISAKRSILFCTTFPCHNCAKHILAAGVEKVIYIEPYPKSKALKFHSESIKIGIKTKDSDENHMYFEPFMGVGPRKFFDLFSLNLGSGRTIKRKDKSGKTIEWIPKISKPKMQLFSKSYIEREKEAADTFNNTIHNDYFGNS